MHPCTCSNWLMQCYTHTCSLMAGIWREMLGLMGLACSELQYLSLRSQTGIIMVSCHVTFPTTNHVTIQCAVWLSRAMSCDKTCPRKCDCHVIFSTSCDNTVCKRDCHVMFSTSCDNTVCKRDCHVTFFLSHVIIQYTDVIVVWFFLQQIMWQQCASMTIMWHFLQFF